MSLSVCLYNAFSDRALRPLPRRVLPRKLGDGVSIRIASVSGHNRQGLPGLWSFAVSETAQSPGRRSSLPSRASIRPRIIAQPRNDGQRDNRPQNPPPRGWRRFDEALRRPWALSSRSPAQIRRSLGWQNLLWHRLDGERPTSAQAVSNRLRGTDLEQARWNLRVIRRVRRPWLPTSCGSQLRAGTEERLVPPCLHPVGDRSLSSTRP